MPLKDPIKRKEYKTQWNKQNYLINSEKEKKRIFERRNQITQWFREYKSTLACNVCGENFPACLDFHHKDRAEKDINLASLRNSGWGIEHIKKEIAKCVVLCSNCHRKLHAGALKI